MPTRLPDTRPAWLDDAIGAAILFLSVLAAMGGLCALAWWA